MSVEIAPELARDIGANEHVLWVGRPDPVRYAFRKGWKHFAWGIPLLAFATMWTVAAYIATRADPTGEDQLIRTVAPFFGLIFVAAGLRELLMPLWLWVQARSLRYVITDRRIVIFYRFPRASVGSIGPHQMNHVRKIRDSQGRGSLILSERTRLNYIYYLPFSDQEGIFGVPEIDDVERLVRDYHMTKSGTFS